MWEWGTKMSQGRRRRPLIIFTPAAAAAAAAAHRVFHWTTRVKRARRVKGTWERRGRRRRGWRRGRLSFP